MAEDKSVVGARDRVRVAGDEDYDVQAFAQRHGMARNEVREMIERIGNSCEALEREAAKLKRH